MKQNSKLALECLAIGSLPHNNLDDAMDVVQNCFENIPFWPQLTKISKNEDMIVQFLDNMPSFFNDNEKIYLETESDEFLEKLEQFFIDFEEVTENIFCENTDNYSINSSVSFERFLQIIKNTKPNYAKGQIVGP